MLRRIAAAIAVTIFALLLRPAAAPAQASASSVVLPDLGMLREVAPAGVSPARAREPNPQYHRLTPPPGRTHRRPTTRFAPARGSASPADRALQPRAPSLRWLPHPRRPPTACPSPIARSTARPSPSSARWCRW